MLLPKKYLSYSAMERWKSSRDAFRDIYYYGKPTPETRHTLHGKLVHEQLERDERTVSLSYPDAKKEYKIEVNVDDVPALGYIDRISFDSKALFDLKVGTYKPDGKPRWSKLEVHKLKQLPFYSMLLQEKFGTCFNETAVVWLVSADVEVVDVEEFEGHELTRSRKEIQLTGEEHVFMRTIEQWERDKAKADFIRVANEISNDYTLWTKKH